jgi:hypothetical protein
MEITPLRSQVRDPEEISAIKNYSITQLKTATSNRHYIETFVLRSNIGTVISENGQKIVNISFKRIPTTVSSVMKV